MAADPLVASVLVWAEPYAVYEYFIRPEAMGERAATVPAGRSQTAGGQ